MKNRFQEEYELNQQTYKKLKAKYAQTKKGQFIGIVDGKVVAEAETIDAVFEKLDQIEPIPSRRFVFRAGEEYPEKITLL
jgi:dihydroxyacetone kinase-like predicted kinase